MNSEVQRSIAVLLIIFAAAILGKAMVPKPLPKSQHPDLEAMIPRQFDDWSIDPSITPVLPSPDQQQQLRETYDQIVNRTYVNGAMQKIMVSIAYGGQQSQKLMAHRQEGCYASQGFQIKGLESTRVRIAGTDLTVTRMIAIANQRVEPVTYWFTVGNKVVNSRLDRLLRQIQIGIGGSIPDGMLVRISSLNSNAAVAYDEQLKFINRMLVSMPSDHQQRFVGNSFQ